jgi:hypothetical protein
MPLGVQLQPLSRTREIDLRRALGLDLDEVRGQTPDRHGARTLGLDREPGRRGRRRLDPGRATGADEVEVRGDDRRLQRLRRPDGSAFVEPDRESAFADLGPDHRNEVVIRLDLDRRLRPRRDLRLESPGDVDAAEVGGLPRLLLRDSASTIVGTRSSACTPVHVIARKMVIIKPFVRRMALPPRVSGTSPEGFGACNFIRGYRGKIRDQAIEGAARAGGGPGRRIEPDRRSLLPVAVAKDRVGIVRTGDQFLVLLPVARGRG